ncbi:hypothetical protein GTR04_6950 [Trichophyton interdigitale]|nr:hypothetical protein GY631_6949 [Trichophyton interdigitale]KAG5217191.1 hypothetical protein GY632_6802 [Trichophyton interdigitale]KAG8205669.1 hypothetical protein GTR04_6950 [Trichophyton interdigitale]
MEQNKWRAREKRRTIDDVVQENQSIPSAAPGIRDTKVLERRDKETNLDLQERRSQRSLDGFRLRAWSLGGRLAE